MAGDESRVLRRLLGRAGIVLVLLGLAVFVYTQLSPGSPRESLCDQGATLHDAGLLQQAQELLAKGEAEGEHCAAGERAEIEASLDAAERTLSSARAFGAVEPTGSTDAQKQLAAQRNANRSIRRYLAGLKVSPFDEAARIGLAAQLAKLTTPTDPRAAGSRCRLSSRLADIALLDYATTVASKGLPEALRDCRKALVATGRQQVEAAALSRQAMQLDSEGAAPATIRERYAAALQKNAQLSEARSGLEAAIDEESCLDAIGDWLSEVPATLKSALAWLIPLLALLLVAVLVLASLARLLTRPPWVSQRLARWSGKRPGRLISRYLAVPEISVVDFEGGGDSTLGGKDFSTLLAERLPHKAGREPAFPFAFATKGSKSDQLAAQFSEVLTEVPQAKALGGLVKLTGRLFRRRRIVVGGRLIPISNPRGAGVAVALEGTGGGPESSITIWEASYDPLPGGEKDGARWMRLLPAAMVWTRWQIAARVVPDLDPERWRADALFQTAVAWQDVGDVRRAESLYVQALELDATLLPATHNLATIAIGERRYTEARDRLLALQEQLRTNPTLKNDWPLVENGYLYSLLLAYAYDSGNRARNLKSAVATGNQLVGMVARRLDAKGPREDTEATDLAELERTEAPSVVALAYVMVLADTTLRREAVGRIARREKTDPITRGDLVGRLGELKPWDLVDGYVMQRLNLSRRTHYNLACYYAALAVGTELHRDVCLDLAVASLKRGLEGRGSLPLVHRDPSLEPLRQDQRRWNELLTFLEGHSVQPHPVPPQKG
ncbi:MAG: hypothetical protein ABW065_01475 [Solirubrobacterales bacterium]